MSAAPYESGADRAPHVLRRDGHYAGAGRWRMTDEQWNQFNAEPVTASPEDIAKLRAAVRRRQEKLGEKPWYNGILTAISWALGEGPTAPVTGQPTLDRHPSWTEIAEEIDAAEDVLAGQRPDDRPADYVTGVEHSLMWLISDTEEPPVRF